MKRARVALDVLLLGVLAACSSSPVASLMTLPADAPMTLSDCTWPTTTHVVYAGWTTLDALGLGDGLPQGERTERAYVVVSAEPVTQYPSLGPAIVARALCVKLPTENAISLTTLPEGWSPPP